MSNERRVIVHHDKQSLAGAVAARFITKVVDLQDEKPEVNIVLTGGSVGTAVLASINASPARDTVDWSRV
jgi:6-phosphogluconolactonase